MRCIIIVVNIHVSNCIGSNQACNLELRQHRNLVLQFFLHSWFNRHEFLTFFMFCQACREKRLFLSLIFWHFLYLQSSDMILSDFHRVDPLFVHGTHIVKWDHVSVGDNHISRKHCNLGIEVNILTTVSMHHLIERVNFMRVHINESCRSDSILPDQVAAAVGKFQILRHYRFFVVL